MAITVFRYDRYRSLKNAPKSMLTFYMSLQIFKISREPLPNDPFPKTHTYTDTHMHTHTHAFIFHVQRTHTDTRVFIFYAQLYE